MFSFESIVVTEQTQELLDDLTILTGPKEALFPFIAYGSLVDNLYIFHQLYDIFNYNYEMIKKIYPDGNMIALNSHTISLASAGKNLNDVAETCINVAFSDGELKKEQFHLNYTSKEYDNNYSYRFMCLIRDYTQHMHVAVYRYGEYPCFDLKKIFDSPPLQFQERNARRSNSVD